MIQSVHHDMEEAKTTAILEAKNTHSPIFVIQHDPLFIVMSGEVPKLSTGQRLIAQYGNLKFVKLQDHVLDLERAYRFFQKANDNHQFDAVLKALDITLETIYSTVKI